MRVNRIEMITLGCIAPAAVAAAYCEHLHYRTVGAGSVSAQLAQMWGREALAGVEYLLLAPAADTRHCIRLLETDTPPGHRPFSAAGWCAAEILVNDVDSLAGSLGGSPFSMVGAPADLSFTDKIRACQVVGPAGEALYLTQVKGDIPGFDLPRAGQTVAYCFVAILATTSLSASKDYYQGRFGMANAPVIEARVTMMSAAFDLPREQLHRISALTLGNPAYLLEVDELPPTGVHQPTHAPTLPPGIAMVSFDCNGSVAADHETLTLLEPPYNGRRVGFCTGPSGEMLELIYGNP